MSGPGEKPAEAPGHDLCPTLSFFQGSWQDLGDNSVTLPAQAKLCLLKLGGQDQGQGTPSWGLTSYDKC